MLCSHCTVVTSTTLRPLASFPREINGVLCFIALLLRVLRTACHSHTVLVNYFPVRTYLFLGVNASEVLAL